MYTGSRSPCQSVRQVVKKGEEKKREGFNIQTIPTFKLQPLILNSDLDIFHEYVRKEDEDFSSRRRVNEI